MGEWIDAILIQKQGRCWLLLHNIRLNAALLSCRRSFCLWLTSMLRSCRRHANEPNISSFPSCITQTAQHPRQLGGAPSMLNTQSIHAFGLAPLVFQSFRPFPQEAFSQANVIFSAYLAPRANHHSPEMSSSFNFVWLLRCNYVYLTDIAASLETWFNPSRMSKHIRNCRTRARAGEELVA